MSVSMDVDSASPRGVKRKVDELSVVTAPRRIKVSLSNDPLLSLLLIYRPGPRSRRCEQDRSWGDYRGTSACSKGTHRECS
jgi:hypothetical protein